MEFFLIPSEVQDPFMLPPGVSEAMVRMWRRAFDAAVSDPGFLADTAKRNQDVHPKNGEYVTKAIAKMLTSL